VAQRPKCIIQARDIRKTFGDFVAVDSLSFDLFAGECLGLLGPNGAGKTSTIRMIYGFSPMSGGTLQIFGLDIRSQWRAIKYSIGVCQQDNNLDPDLSVQQNMEVFAAYFDIPRREARAKAEKLLRFIGLDHRKDSKVTELSGGMMRRMVLARALMNDPELLILDEPTTGLDPQARHQVWERLEELRSDGLSILLTTHYMDEAARLCDRLIIMDHGKILVEGKPADLVREHAGHEVIELTEPSEQLREIVRSHDLRHEDLGHRLVIYDGIDDGLFQRIREDFCHKTCTLRLATLEDVFLILTGRELRE